MSQPFQPPAVGASQPSSTPKDRDAIFSKIYNYPWTQDSDFQTGFSSIAGDIGRNASGNPGYHETDLLLQAQCFYYARKHNLPDPVDIVAYKSWMSTEARSQPTIAQTRPNLHGPLSNPPYTNKTRNEDTAAAATIAQIDGTSSSTLNPNSNSDSDSNPPNRPTTSSPSSSNPSQTSTSTSTQETAQPAAPLPTNFSSIVDLITRGQPIPGVENIPDTVLDPSLSQPDSTPQRRKPWEKGDEEKEKEEEEEEEKKKDGEGAGPKKEA
ncbi:hypothetical protein GJ744_012056 [Endocarpon pusillum]|uniref:Uncharacterized protein n=1 Tax=Endocarpon pusillum TaxID=364733 RepID=A0A8H7E993_9EURO|nr:hypothetical protein GJ744_012056 [Endocarpon pusillum]